MPAAELVIEGSISTFAAVNTNGGSWQVGKWQAASVGSVAATLQEQFGLDTLIDDQRVAIVMARPKT